MLLAISNLQRCYYQNSGIMESLDKHRALEINQIKIMHYKSQAMRTCQHKMNRLYQQGKVNRERSDYNSPYNYFIDKPEQMNHVIAINWVFLWIKENLNKNWESISYWEMQKKHGEIIPDGFIGIKNTATNKTEFQFIEIDIAESGHKFEKIPNYIDYYREAKWHQEWWTKETKNFPDILIVTTSPNRLREIKKLVERQNKEITVGVGQEKKIFKLNFDVYLLMDIKACFNQYLIR